jgi:hypothetical protein
MTCSHDAHDVASDMTLRRGVLRAARRACGEMQSVQRDADHRIKTQAARLAIANLDERGA